MFWLKILSGIVLSIIYTEYYGDGKLSGDTIHYYEDGQVLNKVFFESPSDYFTLMVSSGSSDLVEKRMSASCHWTRSNMDQFNDNRFIIRINSIISFISFNSYFVHVAIFVMLSLLGLILFFKSIQEFIPRYQKEILLLIVLFPSILFWTSSILKESLLIFGFGMLIYGVRFFGEYSFRKLMFIILGLIVLLNTKVYFLLCLLPALIVYLISDKSWKGNLLKISGLIGGAIFFLYLNSFSDSFNITKFVSQKQQDFELVGKGGIYFMDDANFYRVPFENAESIRRLRNSVIIEKEIIAEVKSFGSKNYSSQKTLKEGSLYEFYEEQMPSQSAFHVPLVKGKWYTIVFYSPVFISNVFLMPYPWQNGSNLKWLNIFENLLLISLIVFTIRYRRKKDDIDQKLLFCSLIFILLFYLVIGATTPIVGALVRYKTPAFLIWILLFLSIIDLERIPLKTNSKG